MEITAKQYKIIENLLPIPRGNVKISNLQVLSALLYIAEHGCKWRGLPNKFGRWHSIYMRANRWAKQGVLDDVFHLSTRQYARIVKSWIAHPSKIIVFHLIHLFIRPFDF